MFPTVNFFFRAELLPFNFPLVHQSRSSFLLDKIYVHPGLSTLTTLVARNGAQDSF